MKSALAVIFALVVGTTVYGQPYIPLLGESNSWHAVSCLNGCFVDSYGTAGDTTINGLDYKILDGHHYIQGNFLIREDVQERKVYMKILGGHVLLDEYLIYDFSLNDGDSVHVYNPISPLPEDGGIYVVDSILTQPLENGPHRFFFLHAVNPATSGSNSSIWVEGVGSLSLINSPGQAPSEEDHLGCAFKNGILQYADTDSIEGCSQLSSIEPIPESGFKIYPSIFSRQVNIEPVNHHSSFGVFVYNLDGKLVYKTPQRKSANISISSSKLPQGLLIIQLVVENGEVIRKRIINRPN